MRSLNDYSNEGAPLSDKCVPSCADGSSRASYMAKLMPATKSPRTTGIAMRWALKDGGELELFADFIPKLKCPELFAAVHAAVAWRQREIRIAGKPLLEPRLTAWVGDPEAVYTYSGRRNVPEPWPQVLSELRAEISRAAQEDMNSVLCNLYRDGNDSMGFHSDRELELGANPVIASLSLGVTRRFQLRHRSDRAARLDLELESGSLLIMRGSLQHHFRHAVPKQPALREPRINLTFRRIRMCDALPPGAGGA
jgi:alkylated DNA repair dioxygenase AlkB